MGMVRDFSIDMTPKTFTVAPDTFNAPPIIAAGTLKQMSGLATDLSDPGGKDLDATLNRLSGVFRMLMPGPDGERLAARMMSNGGPDDPPPIDLRKQVIPILMWLLEEYGMRPTQPSSASSDGSTDGTDTTPNGGTDSTDGALLPDSATT